MKASSMPGSQRWNAKEVRTMLAAIQRHFFGDYNNYIEWPEYKRRVDFINDFGYQQEALMED